MKPIGAHLGEHVEHEGFHLEAELVLNEELRKEDETLRVVFVLRTVHFEHGQVLVAVHLGTGRRNGCARGSIRAHLREAHEPHRELTDVQGAIGDHVRWVRREVRRFHLKVAEKHDAQVLLARCHITTHSLDRVRLETRGSHGQGGRRAAAGNTL